MDGMDSTRERKRPKRLLQAVTPSPPPDDLEEPLLPPAEGDDILPKDMRDYLHPSHWVKYEAKCLTCKAFRMRNRLPNGKLVCATIMKGYRLGPPVGYTIPAILEEITPLMKDWPKENVISNQSLLRHKENHFNAKDAAQVALANRDQNRALAGANAELARVLQPMMLIDKALMDSWELMERGVLQVTSVGEVVSLMRFQEELRSKGSEDQSMVAFFTNWAFMGEAMRKVLPPEMYTELMATYQTMKREPVTITKTVTKDVMETEVTKWERGERLSQGEDFDDVVDD